jgi:quercetin dioxygenase-like cupin family protein
MAPGSRLDLDPGSEQTISVSEGVIYVLMEDDEVVLTPGDSLTIPAGERRRAWNAGDETARVEVSSVAALALAA